MALTVLVRSGSEGSALSISLDTPRLVIGRGEACEVRLPDPSVSQRHASIRQRGSDYLIVDEGSMNGTFVGPVRLSPQAPRVLRSGDKVRVGRIWLEVRLDAMPLVVADHTATKELAMALVEHALQAEGEQTETRILVVEGPDTGKSLALIDRDQPYVLGRAKGCALILEDVDASRRHVEFTRTAGGVKVRDLGAKNGTLLGNRQLSNGESCAWVGAAEVVIGANRIRCEDPVAEALAELDRAADEKLREDEVIAPSPGDATEDSAPSAEGRAHSSEMTPQTPPAAPSLRPQQAGAKAPRRGWTTTDYLVLLVALAIIALSLFGLSWLFSAD